MSKLKSINHKGYINPLQKEYIKLFWKKKQEIIFNNNKQMNIPVLNILIPNVPVLNVPVPNIPVPNIEIPQLIMEVD